MTDTIVFIDTIYVVDTIGQTSTDLELLTQVNDFYNSAWDKLIWIIGIGIALVGVVIPLLINWLQRQSLREERRSVRDETNRITQFYEKQTDKLITQTRDDLNKRIDKMVGIAKTAIEKFSEELKKSREKLDEKIKKESFLGQGMLFEFQAMNFYDNKKFDLCFGFSRVAIILYLIAKDYENTK